MKTVIITGAGTGIGAATAMRLAAAEWNVVLVGRRKALLDQTADQIRSTGGKAHAIAADVAEAEAPAKIVAEALSAFGALDALVNNAATIKVVPLADYTIDDLDRHWTTNIRGPFLLIQAALPHLRQHGGSIVNISSSSGTLVRPGQSLYGMTKAALDYLTRSFAGELAPARIRVNALALGPVDTPIHMTWASDLNSAYEWLASQVPLGRIANADEIARWIELLLSSESAWMTGAVIPLDGGQTLDIQ